MRWRRDVVVDQSLPCLRGDVTNDDDVIGVRSGDTELVLCSLSSHRLAAHVDDLLQDALAVAQPLDDLRVAAEVADLE